MVHQAERFTLSGNAILNDANADEENEDDELEAIRRRRLEHMQNLNSACITEIHEKAEFLEILEATRNGKRAILHLYRDDMEATETLNEALKDIAASANSCAFYKVKPAVLEMSDRFVRTFACPISHKSAIFSEEISSPCTFNL